MSVRTPLLANHHCCKDGMSASISYLDSEPGRIQTYQMCQRDASPWVNMEVDDLTRYFEEPLGAAISVSKYRCWSFTLRLRIDGVHMKCNGCHAAEPVIKYHGTVPYWHKGYMTSIQGVNLYVCLRCGYEFIPSGHAQRWLVQTTLFRAKIDTQEPDKERRPESLKGKIMVEWLSLDPDQLAAGLLEEEGTYVRWEDLANYAEQHRNKAFEAFAGYSGSPTVTRPGCAFLCDWVNFLDALRKARAIAAEPGWEAPRDGVAYQGMV
jgi:hypothetical protein